MTTDYTTMTVDELVTSYNAMLAKADVKFEREKSEPVVKFTTKTEGINRCFAIEAMLEDRPVPAAPETRPRAKKPEAKPAKAEEEKEAMTTKTKKTAKKKVAKKKAKAAARTAVAPRTKGLELLRITGVADDAKRREGTRAAKVFAEMRAYVKRNPKKSVAEVIKATEYTTTDFNWDRERGFIKVASNK